MKAAPSCLYAGELLFWTVALAVLALTWTLGEISYAIAVMVAVVVVAAVFRIAWRRTQRAAAVGDEGYSCDACAMERRSGTGIK